jgi:hypothetical protein
MQTLLSELEAKGLTQDQIRTLFLTIHEWLEDNYPVIAKISQQAMVQELGITELNLSSYTVIDPVIRELSA